MNPATVLTLLSVVETIIQQTPAAVALFQQVKAVLTQGGDPSADQWKGLLEALAAAHSKVQAA